MAVSPVRREQRAVLAAWLNDRFGHTLEPQPGKDRVLDGAFWKDAYDPLSPTTCYAPPA
jgi:hypothetical protein